MTSAFRPVLFVSTLALGFALGLQPLSFSVGSLDLGSAGALAKGGGNGGGDGNGGGHGGGGNGGGNGGGHGGGGHGDGGGRGGDGGRGGESRGGGHAGDKSDKSDRGGSQHDRGSRDASRSGSRGNASGGGRAEPVSILGGFLSDLFGDGKTGRTRGDRAKSTTEKSAKAREDRSALAKGAKARDTRAPVEDEETVTSTTTTTSKEKNSLGRLNAAHALANGKPNGSLNSTVGQLRTYMEAVKAKDMTTAASALMGLANKSPNEKTIEALNQILDLNVSAAEIMAAIDKAEDKAPDGTDTPSTDATEETPSDTAETSPDQPSETPSDTADASTEEPGPAPSDTATP